MAIRRSNLAYGMGDNLISLAPDPIVAKRAPTTRDKAPIGTIWVDQPNDDSYILTSIVANSATWINAGGGTGTFNALTVTTTASIGTTLLVGGVVTLSNLGLGVVQSGATGILTSSAGTDGQILCGSTAAAPAWTSITSATLVITPGAGTLNIEESGGTANSFVTDIGGPVAPLVGVTTIAGGTNITTDGTVANTITFNLDNSIILAGAVTAGVNFTMSSGICTVTSNADAAQAIYLHANGGTNETIDIYSDQGTSVASVNIHSDLGGLTLASGLASADAINLTASNAAGGIDVDYGTGGLSIVGADGAFLVETGTAAINIGTDAVQKVITLGNVTGTTSVVVDCGTGAASFGASATAHTTTIGSTVGASSTVIQSGTGDVIVTSTDDITVDCAGVLELNSTAGIISIANDNDNFNLNLGTAGERVVTIGNVTGATQVVLNSGTAGIQLASTGAGDITINSDDTLLLDADGVLELNSSAGIISIGNDNDAFDINLGTGSSARVITIGNNDTTTSVVVDCGTGACSFGATATAHITTIGSTDTTSQTIIQSGTGDLTLTSTDDITIDGAGVVEINSTAGDISIGNDNDAYNVNIGTGAAAKVCTVGSTNTTSSTTVQSGTGGISLEAAGIVDVVPAVDTQAGAAVTVDANVGVATFTGLSTAAAASQVLTITNAVATVGSAILCSLSTLGANDAQCTITRVVPAAGSFTVTYQNLGAAAVNGDLILTFWILAA